MLFITTILAQASKVPIDTAPDYKDVAILRGLEGVVANLIRAVLGLGGIVLFIMLIMGGFNYITSGGDPQKSAAARRTLTYAIGGFVLIAATLLIITIIEEVTAVKVDLLRFKVYCSEPDCGL